MVFPLHNRLVVRGQFGTTEEIWSNTLHFPSVAAGGPDVKPADWDEAAVTSAVNAFYGSSKFSSMAKVIGWRGYQIGADGTTTAEDIVRVDYETPIAGAAAVQHPPQVALVISLTGADRGPGQHGRIYLPGPIAGVSATLCTIPSAVADAYLVDFKAYVEALKDAMYDVAYTNEALVNVSNIGASGAIQDVATYRCGIVLDTIRSRRNKLVEAYSVLAA